MNTELSPGDLADGVANVLAGEWTQVPLGTWAHRAYLNDLNAAIPISRRHRPEIAAMLYRLMALAEGAEFALDRSSLEALMAEIKAIVLLR
jgi:hypothetical protein